jgi:hypothetical protein
LINKKSHNESLQREEDRYDGEPLDRNIIERARAAGINPSPILEGVINAVRNVDSSNPDGVCTDSDVEQFRKVLIEKVQQILNKYQINRIEIGTYPDSYAMNGYVEVQLFLTSSGHLYEQYHDGRTQYIELSSYALDGIHSPKHILYNLFEKRIQVTEKNKAKIKELEDFASDSSLGTVSA